MFVNGALSVEPPRTAVDVVVDPPALVLSGVKIVEVRIERVVLLLLELLEPLPTPAAEDPLAEERADEDTLLEERDAEDVPEDEP